MWNEKKDRGQSFEFGMRTSEFGKKKRRKKTENSRQSFEGGIWNAKRRKENRGQRAEDKLGTILDF